MAGRDKLEVLFRMRQRVMRDQRGDVGQFGRFGAEEFSARWSIEEEIADGDGCPARQCCIFHAADFAAGDLDARAGGLLTCGCFQGDASHGCD